MVTLEMYRRINLKRHHEVFQPKMALEDYM